MAGYDNEGSAALGTLVRAWRERALLSQEELAHRSGLSVGTVRGLESGRIRRPRSVSVRQLAEALGLADEDRTALVSAVTGTQLAADAGVVPAQLPPAVAGFTGRVEAIAELDRMQQNRSDVAPGSVVIAAIGGTAGVGKTALAVHWAYRVADRFPDGQLYVNLRGFDPSGMPLDPMLAVRGFLDALGVPAERMPSPQAQVGLYRSLLARRRMLVVLDNARDVEQVRPLLPGAEGCLVIVTSRDRLSGLIAVEGARPLLLDLLTPVEARQLLERRLGADRVAAAPGAVDEIIARCARLPLALALVAARAAVHPGFPLSALAHELGEAGTRLDALSDPDSSTDLRGVFSYSYHALTPGAARLFRLLGLQPGPDITTRAAASLAGVTVLAARQRLAELTRAHLTSEHVPGRYAIHDLLSAYALELAGIHDTEADRREAQHRLFDHYCHTAHTAALLLNPHRNPITVAPHGTGVTPEELADHQQALAWLTAEYPVLVSVIRQAARAGFDRHTWQLVWALTNFFDRRGYWHDWVAAQHTAVGAARRLGDQLAQAHAYRGLGNARYRLGSYPDARAYLTHSLQLFDKSGDRRGQAEDHITLGLVSDRQGDNRRALEHAGRAFELFQEIRHLAGQAASLNDMGWQHAQLGNYEQAIVHCQQALTLQHDVGDRYGQAHTWDSLGYAHHHIGRYELAADCYQQALVLFRSLGDRYFEADTLDHLGETHQAAGRLDTARDAWQQALGILHELDHAATNRVSDKLSRLSDAVAADDPLRSRPEPPKPTIRRRAPNPFNDAESRTAVDDTEQA